MTTSHETPAQLAPQQVMQQFGIPKRWFGVLSARDGDIQILLKLRRSTRLVDIARGGSDQQILWQNIGLYYRSTNRPYQALLIFRALYYRMIEAQIRLKKWVFKSMPLVWIADIYSDLDYPFHSTYYMMLCACEHAYQSDGHVDIETGGVYFRLAWKYGMTHDEIFRYAKEAYQTFASLGSEAWFPERVLLGLDNHWMTASPSQKEVLHYDANPYLVKHLLKQIGKSKGIALELLTRYVLSCIPGVRSYQRTKTQSSDLDVIASLEGKAGDFRDELGRYLICECKDWKRKADFTTIAKFCRVLDSAKCKAGILVSRSGLSGEAHTTDAARERLKVYQDRGLIILTLTLEDFRRIANGDNALAILRARYEAVRFDLSV